MGTSVLFITHDIGGWSRRWPTRCVSLYKGRIVERGGVRPVLKKPLHYPLHARSSRCDSRHGFSGQNACPRRPRSLPGGIFPNPLPRRPTQDGRLVALSEEEILQMSV